MPIGAVAHANGDSLSLFGCIYSLKEPKKISASAKGTLADADALGDEVGKALIAQGAKEYEKEWREKYGSW